MSTGNQVAIIPANFQLPAYLQTPEATAAIAAYNAAAAGGIKTGGFPRISIKGSKFHIVKGGETTTIMEVAQPGQPALPKMLLEVVVLAANPGLSKTYYEGEYTPGDDREPNCSSDNGITPDSHIAQPQHANCATCPQNQWGSKISKASGKEVKACNDAKRLAVIPAADLGYEALGFAITPSSLGDWGKYVKALSERGIPVNAIVTNITFDATAAHPKTLFSFNRMLTEAEYAKVIERAGGDDVKDIVTPVRQIRVPQLPPAASTAPAAPAAPAAPLAPPPPVIPVQPVAPQAPAAPTTGFGATAPAVTPAAVTPAAPAPEKPKRAPRKQVTPAETVTDISHLPAEVQATVNVLGVNDPIAQALIAKYPKPAAVEPAATPVSSTPPVVPAPAAAAPGGFGATAPAATTPVVTPAAAPVGGAPSSLAAQLAARLAAGQNKATPPAAQ